MTEEWEKDRGYVIWELEEWEKAQADDEALDDEALGSWVGGRKWVHDESLLFMSQHTERAVALKDKNPTLAVPHLGRIGQKRFAPRLGARAGGFNAIQPGSSSCVLVVWCLFCSVLCCALVTLEVLLGSGTVGDYLLRIDGQAFEAVEDRNQRERSPSFVFCNETKFVQQACDGLKVSGLERAFKGANRHAISREGDFFPSKNHDF